MERLGFVCIMMSAFVTFQWAARASSPCSSRSGSRGSWYGTRSRLRGLPVGGVALALLTQVLDAFRGLQIRRFRSGFFYHFLQDLRILQHRTWSQVIVIKWLMIPVSHKQRLFQCF
mgnify:CR=1 FL=1